MVRNTSGFYINLYKSKKQCQFLIVSYAIKKSMYTQIHQDVAVSIHPAIQAPYKIHLIGISSQQIDI